MNRNKLIILLLNTCIAAHAMESTPNAYDAYIQEEMKAPNLQPDLHRKILQ